MRTMTLGSYVVVYESDSEYTLGQEHRSEDEAEAEAKRITARYKAGETDFKPYIMTKCVKIYDPDGDDYEEEETAVEDGPARPEPSSEG